MPLPPLAIHCDCGLLDAETARIDALTGSIPTASLPWLTGFPAGWPVMRISFVARLLNGTPPSRDNPDYWGGNVPWLASSVAGQDVATEPTEYVTQQALADCSLAMAPPGGVLVALYAQGQTRASSSVLSIRSTFNLALVALVPFSERLNAHFLHLLGASYDMLRSIAQGGQQANLNTQQLAAWSIPVPAVSVQEAIAATVRERGSVLARAASELQHSMSLLAERRQALITAAVTGQMPTPGVPA